MDLTQEQIVDLLFILRQDGVSAFADSLKEYGIIVDIEKIDDALSDIEEVLGFLASEAYGPAPTEELQAEAIRLLIEVFAPGRELIIEPVVNIPEGEEVGLHGTIATAVLINNGALVDDGGRFGNNLFAGILGNNGEIAFDKGKDSIVSIGGGLVNTGEVSTGSNSDLVSGSSSGASFVDGILNEGVIDTGVGNDRVVGNALSVLFEADGIENRGPSALIRTRRGDDFVFGEAAANDEAIGIENESGAVISTGVGNDVIFGEANSLTGLVDGGTMVGIFNFDGSTINAGRDDDIVNGFAFAFDSGVGGDVAGIVNENSAIVLGSGNDFLFGEGFSKGDQATISGISSRGCNEAHAVLDLGCGDDWVLGFAEEGFGAEGGSVRGIELINSKIVSYDGNNLIDGGAEGGIFNSGIFIDSSSVIKLGTGNDEIVGSAFGGESNQAITNFGRISTGRGDDIVDATFGGFGGDGLTRLGLGNDTLVGFGSGFFNAGGGVEIGVQQDRLLLENGVYTINTMSDQNGYFDLTRARDGITMKIQGFELLGSEFQGDVIDFILAPSAVGRNLITIDNSFVSIVGVV